MSKPTKPSYKFGPFILDTANACLLKNGKFEQIRPTPFKVLLILIQNRHRVVTKEELIELLDPDTIKYGDSMLAKNISYVRKALGDLPAEATYVKTFPKRGYRFIKTVQEVSGQEMGQMEHGIQSDRDEEKANNWKKAVHSDEQYESRNITLPPPLPCNKISIARLPKSGPYLFGRDAELQRLDDAWDSPNTNIITFFAEGGAGKTALVNHWLFRCMAPDNWRQAARVYVWSFYSQGTNQPATSAIDFINAALLDFGDTDSTQGLPGDKGERLARLMRQARTLLILDGIEPLQYPVGPQEGCLKDKEMQTLLVELAAQQPGLCVISTRLPIFDLAEFEGGTVIQHELAPLSPSAGAQLLRALHVRDDDELEKAAEEFKGHAFSLTLLGSYLDEVLCGDIHRRTEIENLFDDSRHGDKAQKMMAAYEKWLSEGVELAVLRLLGLFDRPADGGSIKALCATPPIPGLTEALQNLKVQEWRQALAKLRRIKLLDAASTNDPNTIDAHALVREYFRQQLKHERPDAWREANYRLYEYLKHAVKELPDTVEEMSGLFSAVVHGCAAGRYQEALNEVYIRRIQRGREHFDLKMLGAFDADLAALTSFFEIPWDWEKPVSELTDEGKAFVWTKAGVDLYALGRLYDATQPMQAGLKEYIAGENWIHAAITASNLSELYLTIGNLPQAINFAQQSVELADRSEDKVEQIGKRTTLADALHQAGRTEEAAGVFQESEALLMQSKLAYPFLFSMSGFWYCDLLLSQGQVQEVKERAARMLEWDRVLLYIALDNLLLGCAWLIEAQQSSMGNTTKAAEFLDRAVEGFRQSKRVDQLPRGLLARAALHRFNSDYERVECDLAAMLLVATRGAMGLHLADYHLESARLYLAQGNYDKAREHLATAREMIERMGYHRRDNEVNALAAQLH